MPRYLKNYSKETKKLIESISLNEAQMKKLEECMEDLPPYGNVCLKDVFPDMYKLYVSGTSTEEIAKIYDRTPRTIQSIFKVYGVEKGKKSREKIIRSEVYQLLFQTMKKDYEDLGEELVALFNKHLEEERNNLLK